jgi:N-acetylmuramoyl-L-alanine amidase
VELKRLGPSMWGCCVLSTLLISNDVLAQTRLIRDTPPILAQVSAGRLTSWRFDPSELRFEFRTSGGVQPRAQLVSNPTRLVIDLPGITLGRPSFTQPLTGDFNLLRFGQFDPRTARIVVELDRGHTLDPKQIRFRGLTPTTWTVQLPTPQRSLQSTLPSTGTAVRPRLSRRSATTEPVVSPVQIQGIRTTQDGFLIQTKGGQPYVVTKRSDDRRLITATLSNTVLAEGVKQDLLVSRFGVRRIRLTPTRNSPPSVEATMLVDQDSPNWEARVSGVAAEGVQLIPKRDAGGDNPSGRGGFNSSSVDSQQLSQNSAIAQVNSIELDSSGQRLLIRANQPFVHTSGWDRTTGAYRISLTAQLAPGVQPPATGANSPFLRVSLRQENPNTLVLLLHPASDVRIGALNQPRSDLLSLELSRGPDTLLPPETQAQGPAVTPSNEQAQIIPVPPPETQSIPPSETTIRSIPTLPPRQSDPSAPLPIAPRGRAVVVIDPGHGGPDPGAIGIGGIQEKEIVIDVSRQVASFLERQGIQVVLTRPDDRDLDLEPRVQIARQVNATVFVSIHANAISMSRPEINGVETYYYSSPASARLAQSIHNRLLQMTGSRDRGVRSSRFYVLRRTTMPAVLVETGFVTGQEDAPRLAMANYRTLLAEAISRGILEYLQNP